MNNDQGGIGVVNAASNFTIGIVFYPLFSYFSGSKEIGWRLSFVIPVLMSVFFAFITWICADDTPKGKLYHLFFKPTQIYMPTMQQ